MSEVPFPPMTSFILLPLLHIEYAYTVYLFTQGKGGGELTREKARRAIVNKAG
jgi:hypothetical protein